VPHSRAIALQADVQRVFDAKGNELVTHGIEWALLATMIGAGLFLIEPIITWPDEMLPMHERLMEASYRKRLNPLPPNSEAASLVQELRSDLKSVFALHGATHMQIGRAYPFKDRLAAANWEMLSAVKAIVDPLNLMNPGALGLGTDY
jgi:hypothetical protein